MPVVAGELHLASHAVLDPRRAPTSVSCRRGMAAGTARAAVSAGATASIPLPEG